MWIFIYSVLFHGIALLVWVGEKERQKSHSLTAVGIDIPGNGHASSLVYILEWSWVLIGTDGS